MLHIHFKNDSVISAGIYNIKLSIITLIHIVNLMLWVIIGCLIKTWYFLKFGYIGARHENLYVLSW